MVIDEQIIFVGTFNLDPDSEVGYGKRFRAWMNSLLPMEPIL